ncbi:hypothetical protein OPKNFCMD_6529 [Methylobacterium crusticola]|uniref:ABC transporter substrate-binding protein n=1 Tax=Methylobacterium crusticola TaxID=1697972 RepID=A0ABQ4RAF1_9HYPH|nr:ABC transporter substrate binding protein [Methylobacterium crusticola]GJD53751.1 hypothetical protein OPKNFCMD_6529 [Methylobacterium crusticola]
MNRRALLAGSLAATLARPGRAEPRPWRVGFLHPGEQAYVDSRVAAFRTGFAPPPGSPEIVTRTASNDLARLPALVAELAAEQVQALCAVSPPAVGAVRTASLAMPVVALDLESDPVANGWVESLGQPGRSLTGLFLDLPEFTAKCLQLLVEAAGGAPKVGVLWHGAAGTLQVRAAREAAARLNLPLEVAGIQAAAEIEPAFAALHAAGAGGLLMLSSPLFGGRVRQMAELSARYRLPAINQLPEFAEAGGLLGYGPEAQGMFRQLGALTRRILEAGPGRPLPPVERPVRFKLVLNARTAAALGLTIPPMLLASVDEVIE